MEPNRKNLYDVEAERAFVGCLVAGEGEAFDTCPAAFEHFSDGLARAVFAEASALRQSGAPVAVETVIQRMSDRMEALGGSHQVREACHSPAPSQAEHFFGIIDSKLILRRGVSLARWAEGEALVSENSAEFASELRRRASEIEPQSEDGNMLGPALDSFEAKIRRIESGAPDSGVKTIVPAWNRIFGGILEGQLYGIAGRPGMGKTALMEMLISGLICEHHPVCVFERDMSPQKLVERMACRIVRVPYWKLARNLVGTEDRGKLREAIAMLREMPLIIHNPTGLTPERMCAIARRDIRTKGVRAVFLDHIQTFGTGRDMREKLTSASLTIRDCVTTTGIPFIVLAHINRNGAKGRPAPEDVKEFDQLYGDADGMLMLWSEQDKAELPEGQLLEVKFYGAKNRDGAVSEDTMLFDGQHMRFVEKQ